MVLQKTGDKTGIRAPKLGYFDGWAPQLSARVNSINHGTPTAGVHISRTLGKKTFIFHYGKNEAQPEKNHEQLRSKWGDGRYPGLSGSITNNFF